MSVRRHCKQFCQRVLTQISAFLHPSTKCVPFHALTRQQIQIDALKTTNSLREKKFKTHVDFLVLQNLSLRPFRGLVMVCTLNTKNTIHTRTFSMSLCVWKYINMSMSLKKTQMLMRNQILNNHLKQNLRNLIPKK